MKKIIQFIICVIVSSQYGYALQDENSDEFNNMISGMSFAEFRPIKVTGVHEPFGMYVKHKEFSEPEFSEPECNDTLNFTFMDGHWSTVPQVAHHTGLVQTAFDPWDNAVYVVAKELPDGKFERISNFRNGKEFRYKTTWRINDLRSDIIE